MPSKIPPCNYQRKAICGYHRRAVAAVKFSPGGTLLGSACESLCCVFLRALRAFSRCVFFFENVKTRGPGRVSERPREREKRRGAGGLSNNCCVNGNRRIARNLIRHGQQLASWRQEGEKLNGHVAAIARGDTSCYDMYSRVVFICCLWQSNPSPKHSLALQNTDGAVDLLNLLHAPFVYL